MNNYSSVPAKVLSVSRHKVKGLPIRYLDISLELENGTTYNLPTWAHSPSISISSGSYGNKKPIYFTLFWCEDTCPKNVYIRHMGSAFAYVIPK